jgi:hypothetical protein
MRFWLAACASLLRQSWQQPHPFLWVPQAMGPFHPSLCLGQFHFHNLVLLFRMLFSETLLLLLCLFWFRNPLPLVIPMGQDVEEEEEYYRSMILFCHFNGFWPKLVDLNSWISATWIPVMQQQDFIHPCAKVFFIVEFYIKEY